jgi:hypothetical protein
MTAAYRANLPPVTKRSADEAARRVLERAGSTRSGAGRDTA